MQVGIDEQNQSLGLDEVLTMECSSLDDSLNGAVPDKI